MLTGKTALNYSNPSKLFQETDQEVRGVTETVPLTLLFQLGLIIAHCT